MKKGIFFSIIFTHITFLLGAESQIIEAAKNGDLLAVKSILAQNPSKLNETNKGHFTSLHWACMLAHWDVAEYLINKGAN